MHLVLGMPYAVTSLFWLVVLAVVFFLWNRSEHTLDIHSITTNRREKYYWCVVFATFALGTAVGDFAATHARAGLPRVGRPLLRRHPDSVGRLEVARWNSIFAFWFAYVITRPIGASFADYLSKGHDVSGANFGDWQTALRVDLASSWSWSPTPRWPATTSSRPMSRSPAAPDARSVVAQPPPVVIPNCAMRARSSSGVGGSSRFHSSWRPTK